MKIFIADDDPTSRLLLRSASSKLGYDVEIVSNGAQAWDLLQRPDAPELAILDWMMPGITGPEICRKLRARLDFPYVYVILLTALNDLNALVTGIEFGADDFITKPFRVPELYARLLAGQRILNLQRELVAGRAQIEKLAAQDFLTGLLNRRIIMERLTQELARSRRESYPVGVIMMDLDHFKQINDTYGHSQGDLVLQEVAKRLTETVRPYDSVGRYGGEEFLLLVSHCGVEKTVATAGRLQYSISAMPISLAGRQIHVTASFGVSSTEMGESGETTALVDAADRALYRAKEAGRNRVEWLAAETERTQEQLG